MGYEYYEAKEILDSGVPSRLSAMANTWRNLGVACRSVSDHLRSTSTTVGAQHGATYQIVSDRSGRMAAWLETLGGQAELVGAGLADAGSTGTQAQYRGDYIDSRLKQKIDAVFPPGDDTMSMAKANAMNAALKEAGSEANSELEKWSAAYSSFQPGHVAPAPVTTGGGGTNDSTSTHNTTAQPTPTTSTQTQPTDQSDARATYRSDQSGDTQFTNSVSGKEAGDFEGWVRDPHTGYLVDPVTGREFDPITGRWIDPVTGKPFGDVVQYASRLEGLSGGTSAGLLAAGGGGVGYAPLFGGGGLTGASVAGMYSGAVPPSLFGNNPAAAQLRATAANEMAAKAYAASQLGVREAAAGGRPFVPPMQAGGYGAAGRGGASRSPRVRMLSESARTWTAGNRAPARDIGAKGGGSGQSGARPFVPPTGAGGGKTTSDTRARPDWLVEDDVWSGPTRATGGVLGEEH